MSAGYATTPLAKKLGIKNGSRLLLLHAPEGYKQLIEKDALPHYCKAGEQPEIVQLFAKNNEVLKSEMKGLTPFYKKNPAMVIWVSWYKKAAGISTDLTEDRIREYALSAGLVDIKVCAVTAEWSGLKLMVPVAKRSVEN